jgi:hypothetical protein
MVVGQFRSSGARGKGLICRRLPGLRKTDEDDGCFESDVKIKNLGGGSRGVDSPGNKNLIFLLAS